MMDLDLAELNEWLMGFVNFEREAKDREWNLDNMRVLTEKFEHPEEFCPCFHITGSKGKGTIAAATAAILSEAGYTVGVFGSPHVLHFTERVHEARGVFPAEVYDAAFSELQEGVSKLIEDGELAKEAITWHELTTTYAMLVFRQARVDFAVYEVGAGGRLDASNVVLPVCTMFGPIELEHTRMLGNTLEKIAFEKAGIMKTGVPAISAPQAPEVVKTLQVAAGAYGVKLEFIPDEGDYLAQDFEVARRAVSKVLPGISDEVVRAGLAHVSLPGRYEWREFEGVKILIDAAHTPNSVSKVAERMQRDGISGNLLFGCAEDKNVEKMARILRDAGIFEKVYLTRPGDFKKSDLERMKKAFSEAGFSFEASPDFKKTIRQAIYETDGTLVVLGSFYLAGEVEKIIS